MCSVETQVTPRQLIHANHNYTTVHAKSSRKHETHAKQIAEADNQDSTPSETTAESTHRVSTSAENTSEFDTLKCTLPLDLNFDKVTTSACNDHNGTVPIPVTECVR